MLGHTPNGLEDSSAKSSVYDNEGYDAFIDAFSMMESMTISMMIGVYFTFKAIWQHPTLSKCAFTYTFQMVHGSTSDKLNPRSGVNRITLNLGRYPIYSTRRESSRVRRWHLPNSVPIDWIIAERLLGCHHGSFLSWDTPPGWNHVPYRSSQLFSIWL